MKYIVRGGDIVYVDSNPTTGVPRERVVGPTGVVYVDTNQDVAKLVKDDPRFATKRLVVGDYVFTTTDGKLVVTVEDKKPADFSRSYRSRRLQRQLRHGWFGSDIAVLAMRVGPLHLYQAVVDQAYLEAMDVQEVCLDLLKWQELGGRLAALPSNPTEVPNALLAMRAALKAGRHQLTILAGTDTPRRRLATTPTGRALQSMFKGLGATTADSIAERGRGALTKCLALPDTDWKECGATKNVIEQKGVLG